MPNLCGTFSIARVFPHQFGVRVALPLLVVEPFVMLTVGRFFRRPPVMSDQLQFNLLEPQ